MFPWAHLSGSIHHPSSGQIHQVDMPAGAEVRHGAASPVTKWQGARENTVGRAPFLQIRGHVSAVPPGGAGRWATQNGGPGMTTSLTPATPGAGIFQEDLGVSVLSSDHQGPHLCLQ